MKTGRDGNDVAKSQRMPEAGRSKDSLLKSLEGVWPCQHLDFSLIELISNFWFLEIREYISVPLSHQACDNLLQQP